ncbi:MAG: hypothetical protein MUF24_05635 [Chitinophagaceae bacterium]|nr:hypothetical protein [Chitinophagaceae bacterium]
MGWEKHDNEIRSALQNGTGFLPEEERWDANAAWEKMKQQMQNEGNAIIMQPVGKSTASIVKALLFRRWYAAAAFLLLLGAGIVWKDSLLPTTKEYPPVAKLAPPAAMPKLTNREKDKYKPVETMSTTPETAISTAGKPVPDSVRKAMPTPESADASALPGQTQLASTFVATVQAKDPIELETSKAVALLPEPLQSTHLPLPDSAIARNIVKIRPGIIHLNELGYDGVKPPGFTPRKRYNAKAIIALQNAVKETTTRPSMRKNGIIIPL